MCPEKQKDTGKQKLTFENNFFFFFLQNGHEENNT